MFHLESHDLALLTSVRKFQERGGISFVGNVKRKDFWKTLRVSEIALQQQAVWKTEYG
jgi:hypothetical protein